LKQLKRSRPPKMLIVWGKLGITKGIRFRHAPDAGSNFDLSRNDSMRSDRFNAKTQASG
jgi:hypothetical protein